jgi:hypothetical protein
MASCAASERPRHDLGDGQGERVPLFRHPFSFDEIAVHESCEGDRTTEPETADVEEIAQERAEAGALSRRDLRHRRHRRLRGHIATAAWTLVTTIGRRRPRAR